MNRLTKKGVKSSWPYTTEICSAYKTSSVFVGASLKGLPQLTKWTSSRLSVK